MEEIFFFQYHLRLDRYSCMGLPIPERRFLIDRFIEQKNKEKDEVEKERRKASKKR